MKIALSQLLSQNFEDEAYFEIIYSKELLNLSEEIAKFFNLDVDFYNQLLIDKIIKHNKYAIDSATKDLTFDLNNISEETYLNRFEEAFIDKLTLISLGGDLLED